MDLPYAVCDSVAKAIPDGDGMTIDIALKDSKEFRDMYEGMESQAA